MYKRITNFVESMAYKDVDEKMTFPFDLKHTFTTSGHDHLTELPVIGSVAIDCVVRDETIDIDYSLIDVFRDDKGMLKVIYQFNA
jgi:hypothetical protein